MTTPMQENASLQKSGRFRALLDVPGITTFGTWRPFTWDDGAPQQGLEIVPDSAPWRGLFAALDAVGAALSSEPVDLFDEADAIVATCWRYGSYAHVLTGGELYPPFRIDPELSRLSDREMQRINLEFSSGVASWLTDRTTDPERINRRVRAALSLLPMPWRRNRTQYPEDMLARFDPIETRADFLVSLMMAASVHKLGVPPEWETRVKANYIVNHAYRNGEIENLHAGMWSHGREVPGFVRLYAGDIERIGRVAASRFALYLDNVASMRPELVDDFLQTYDDKIPMTREGVLNALAFPAFYPTNWSLTEETAPIRYLGVPGARNLLPRLDALARRYPTVYGSASIATV